MSALALLTVPSGPSAYEYSAVYRSLAEICSSLPRIATMRLMEEVQITNYNYDYLPNLH